MHAVIGTAGHVDHGKSSLIHALTGIHPSHLPQELARGLTIDLGFAYLDSPNGKIGIIDVPGHERFIRNMVSGVWGLDLVLFVVAADEGWAELSEEHLRVISAMDIKNAIIVLTKADLVDEARLGEVSDDVLERFLSINHTLPEVVCVSAHTQLGMDELKALIFEKVNALSARQDLSTGAHLYVDRVFSVQGIGTTVTGTLRGGSINEDDVLTLFPSGQNVRVRSLQSYHEQREEAEPYSRVAIGLKQVSRKIISRGSCLVAQPKDVTMSTDWIVQLNPDFSEMRKQGEVEVALGTAHTHAQCFVFAEGRLARLQLKEAIPAFWGQPLLLIRQGGSRIIGAGRLVWMGALDRQHRQALQEALPQLEAESHEQSVQLKLHLALNGYTPIQQQATMPEGVEVVRDWWVTPACMKTLFKELEEAITTSVNAVSVDALVRKTGYPEGLVDEIVRRECEANRWQRIDNGIVSVEMRSDGKLPADQAQLLELIQDAGKKGFIPNQKFHPGAQRLLRSLTERGKIVPTIDNMFFAQDVYQDLFREIMQGMKVGDEFGVAEVRDRVELGRKQIIPLLNRLEKDGWVKRVGDSRIVAKIFEQ